MLTEGLKKKWEFSQRWGPSDFGSFSQIFLFIFKHGLNHPAMQRNFAHPLLL